MINYGPTAFESFMESLRPKPQHFLVEWPLLLIWEGGGGESVFRKPLLLTII